MCNNVVPPEYNSRHETGILWLHLANEQAHSCTCPETPTTNDYSIVIGERQFWLQTNFPLSICELDFGVTKYHEVTCDKRAVTDRQAATDHIQKS